MTLLWTVIGILAVMAALTWFVLKVDGPRTMVPRRGKPTPTSGKEEIQKIAKPFMVFMSAMTVVIVAMAVAVIR
ncbi:MAG: hypothetical protein JWP74_3487 [Marmoricola sp.]|nr:hypothetical protein [Marmoricola sp.]